MPAYSDSQTASRERNERKEPASAARSCAAIARPPPPRPAPQNCPHCTQLITWSQLKGELRPLVSVVLCPHCGEPLQVDEALQVKELDPIVELVFWETYPQAVEQLRQIHRRNARRDLQAAIDLEIAQRSQQERTA